jgi:hypothetical protein
MINFTKDQILAMVHPGDLFSSPDQVDEEFRALSVRWHPDHDGDTDVMSKINELRNMAKACIDSDDWKSSNSVIMTLSTGKKAKIQFLSSTDIGIGTMFICESCLAFVIRKEFKELADNIRIRDKMKFAGKRMEEEITKYLPKIIQIRNCMNGDTLIVLDRAPGHLLLKDVLTYFGGKIDGRHVAWILNTLYNLCCYFSYTGIVHHGITIDSYFIDPAQHNGALLGGWWYARPRDSNISVVPNKIYSIMPVRVKNTKKAKIITDLESVKLIGRQLLGDENGIRLMADASVPKPMADFLRDISSSSHEAAIEEYRGWGEVLKESYGPRRFVEMKVYWEKFYHMKR